jgi:hypothetical protein
MSPLLPHFKSRERTAVGGMASQYPNLPPNGSSAQPADEPGNEDSALLREAAPHNLWTKIPLYVYHVTKATLYSTKANYLLVFVLLSIVGANHEWNAVLVFTLSFLAIFPLAELLSWSTEQLAASVGQTLGGLLNASFGNAVEMIVSRLYITLLNPSC